MDSIITQTKNLNPILQEAPQVPPYHDHKVIVDRFLGMLLLVVSAPLIVFLVVLVRASSSGTGIYKQVRVGKGGRKFSIYKIRTMYSDAEACGTPQWALRKDSRITPVGLVLRFLHLDELPQLYNIARGEMSLIGPRPERPEFVVKLSKCVPNYEDRLAVLPGVTGLAQINLPADESLESVRQKVVLDIDYILTASLGLELRIFFCTLVRMLGFRHGVAPKLFGVERNFTAEQSSKLTGETTELAGALDDTAINIPALLVSQEIQEITTTPHPNGQGQEVACLAETPRLAESSLDTADATASVAPRRPR